MQDDESNIEARKGAITNSFPFTVLIVFILFESMSMCVKMVALIFSSLSSFYFFDLLFNQLVGFFMGM